MQDTFYVDPKHLLRSHTTNVQLRIMEQAKPPIRVIAPGTVYRNENISARSHVFFHQVDGLYIDKNVSFGDLIATLKEFWNRLFKKQVATRFRPSFFPFVEPGLEMDIACTVCSGKGCRICKHTGWLEVLGAGMVHPEVLRNGGIDPEVYSGFAWGMGIERMAMLFYGVTDIRAFAENDIRFLRQF
jgi:phenylalanyl-tRNA synthetase alpha chain